MSKWITLYTWFVGAMAFADANAPSGGAAPAGQAPPVGGIAQFVPIILMFAIVYILMIRPQQKKAKLHQKFLTDLKKGDRVITASGIVGTIRQLSEKLVTLEVDDGVNLKIVRSQIGESAQQAKPSKA